MDTLTVAHYSEGDIRKEMGTFVEHNYASSSNKWMVMYFSESSVNHR